MVVAEGGVILDVLCKNRYTLIKQSSNSRITCMQYSQKNFMRIIGNDQKNKADVIDTGYKVSLKSHKYVTATGSVVPQPHSCY